MATINSFKSQDIVMDQINIYLDHISSKPMQIKTYDYKTCGEIKLLIIEYLKQKQEGMIQYNDSQFAASYASYIIVVQMRHKKQPEITYTRKLNPLERPFEIKNLLQQNSKVEFYFIFEDSSNTVEYITPNISHKVYSMQEKSKYIRTGHVGKLKKNESFSEVVIHLYPDHITYSQVKNKNARKQQMCLKKRTHPHVQIKRLIEIFKAISNLQDRKLLDQIDDDLLKSERVIQNHLVQVMDRSNMRCFKCIKKLAYRDKFIEFLLQEQEKYFINQQKNNDRYNILQNVIGMVEFISKTTFNFPPFESVQNNGNSSHNNSMGSNNNLDGSFQGSYTQRKHRQSQDCTKLLKEFFDNQMSANSFFSNFVFKLLEKMHRLQYSKMANAAMEKSQLLQQSQVQGIQVKHDSSHYSQIQLGRISAQSNQNYQNGQMKINSPISSIHSEQSTPLSRFNTNNFENQKEQNILVNFQDNGKQNNATNNITEWSDVKEFQTKNTALFEFLKKKQDEGQQQLPSFFSPERTSDLSEVQQQEQQQQQSYQSPQVIWYAQPQSQSQQQQQIEVPSQRPSNQSLIKFSEYQPSSLNNQDLQNNMPNERFSHQSIIQSRKTTNQSTTSSNFYTNNNNQILHDQIMKYFGQKVSQQPEIKSNPFKKADSMDEINPDLMEIRQSFIPPPEREITDSVFFQNMLVSTTYQTQLVSIELSIDEFQKQVQQFTNEQMLNLILGFIEIEAFSLYVKSGSYYKQIIKSRQQMYQQQMPFDFVKMMPQIINQSSNRFPPDQFFNLNNLYQKNGQNSGVAKVASKK